MRASRRAVTKVIASGFVIVLIQTGCATGKVKLSYRFEAGMSTTYLWKLSTTTKVDSQTEQSSRHIEMTVKVNEEVQRIIKDGAILSLVLTPTRIVEDGIEATPPPPAEIEYETSRTGRIRKLLKAQNIPPGSQSSFELDRLLSENKLPLPNQPVAIGDEWPIPLSLKAKSSSMDLRGNAKLESFALKQRHRLAEISTQRKGDVITNQAVGRAVLNLTGRSTTLAKMQFDVDKQIVYSNSSRSFSNFDLSVGGSGKTGSLNVVLISELRLVGGYGL